MKIKVILDLVCIVGYALAIILGIQLILGIIGALITGVFR